jgi:transcriptional regulator with XRE-family HTH domain
MVPEPANLNALLGKAIQRIRLELDLSQDDVARECRRRGLTWARSTIAVLEAGQKSLQISEALVLADVLGQPFFSFFYEGALDDEVAITSSLVGSLSEVQALNEGGRGFEERRLRIKEGRRISSRARTPRADVMRRLPNLARYLSESELLAVARLTRSEAELRAAHTLGITPAEVSVAAHGLWGRSLIEERERRLSEMDEAEAPLRNLRGYRGHVTRELTRELRNYLRQTEDSDSRSSTAPG